MICYARLDLSIDVTTVQREVGQLPQNWMAHFNRQHYAGEWTVLPLRAPGGNSNLIMADLVGEQSFQNTALMEHSPTIHQLVGGLQCPVLSVRLLNLRAGSVIKQHRDLDLAYEHGEARIHFPIFTNDKVAFYVEDHLIPMHAGECWYINANLPHRVENLGATDRIHLVVDCTVNNWLTGIFERSEKVCKADEQNTSQLKMIINELRIQNTVTSNERADELEKQLSA